MTDKKMTNQEFRNKVRMNEIKLKMNETWFHQVEDPNGNDEPWTGEFAINPDTGDKIEINSWRS